MPVFKKNSRLVGRLESGVSASASSEIFAKTAGAGNVLGREGNCPGGGHVRAEYLRGGGECPGRNALRSFPAVSPTVLITNATTVKSVRLRLMYECRTARERAQMGTGQTVRHHQLPLLSNWSIGITLDPPSLRHTTDIGAQSPAVITFADISTKTFYFDNNDKQEVKVI